MNFALNSPSELDVETITDDLVSFERSQAYRL